MSVQAQPRFTPAQYLAFEREAPYKSELINGQILAMSGASREHNVIAGNVFADLRTQLRSRRCEVYVNDMRVKIDATESYTYPDVVAVCGEPRFEDRHVDTLLNPTLLVEVLSPSTEAYDRGAKFAHYRRIASLQQYVLIAQDRYSVECYTRRGEQWVLSDATTLEAVVHLASIDCRLALREVYDRITLPGDEDDEETGGS